MTYQPQAFKFLQEVSKEVTDAFFHASHPTLRIQVTNTRHPNMTVSLGDLYNDEYNLIMGSTDKLPNGMTPKQALEAEAEAFGEAKPTLTLMLGDEVIQKGTKWRS